VSEEDTALVRRAYASWNQDGPAAIGPLMTDDVELHDAPQLPDAQVWHGRNAVVSRLESVAAAVGGGTVEFEGFEDAGGEIVVGMCWQLESETPDVRLGQVFHVVRVEDGRISSIRVFLTQDEARAAG
jgi:ketosteroid isomerase-like protein